MDRYQNNNLPKSFENLFTRHKDNHNYNTRSAGNFIPIKPTSNLVKHSIQYIGPKMWNSLDPKLKMSISTKNLKINFKTHLINNY